MIFMMILSCVVIGTTGQLLLKHGMDKVGGFTFTLHNVYPIAMKVAGNPFIIGGISCYILSLVIWLMILSRTQVSYAYPMLSLGYIITAIAAHYFFGEALTLARLLGITFIILGVLLIAR